MRKGDLGNLGNYLIFFGSAVLSSSVLAAAIKAWIEGRRRRIVISVADTKLEYEGPSLTDMREIELMIDKLAQEFPDQRLSIQVNELPKQIDAGESNHTV